MKKIYIAPMTMTEGKGPEVAILRDAGFQLVYPSRVGHQLLEEELLRELPGHDAALAGSEPYTRKVLEHAPGLKVIARVGVGYDAVDVPAATDHGIAVTIAPGTNQDAVAEHTFALILAVAKRVVANHNALRVQGWPRQPTVPLRGRTLGIAGLGRIGKAVALRGEAFRMKLLAYEPYPDSAFVKEHGITLVPFEELLAESDFVSLHMPLSAEAKYLINRKTLALMKPTAFLINTARGGLVCEADLLQALKEKLIAGAALDVFEQEPPGENPLLHLENVVATTHNAGVDLLSLDDMAAYAARAVVALSRGEWPAEAIVNPKVKAKFKWV